MIQAILIAIFLLTIPSVSMAACTKVCDGDAWGAGGGGDVSTDAIWTAAGEIVYGTGTETASALSAGATTEILVGGGAAAPVWTTSTGSGAPARANDPILTSPTLTTPDLGTPSAVVLTNATGTAASLTCGNATLAATVTFADAAADTTTFVALGTAATGSIAPATDAGLAYNASTNALTVTGAVDTGAHTATSYTADASATPSLGLTDSDTTDEDVSASIGTNCTDTATTTEDCDVTFTQQVAGADTNFIVADADGSITATTHPWIITIQNGAAPAATCVVGEIFIDTDETVDTNCTTTADNSLCICTASNTWTALENN